MERSALIHSETDSPAGSTFGEWGQEAQSAALPGTHLEPEWPL